ncbi:hypothetical protein BIV57_15885 [Mangrovactinospora gilvigrisea]|uniref:Uncharacterized protein n=1 Tax=Mangrovactinospora gilvigrisea TaxID=1428644 RepID=A0A1J7BSR8_9ACTN|nr:hypothetical protein [Mangrovactinospora gilvigrisea]OIV36505.1 hypothetical protein BIV57_15885 [Mangrovactinospora gilvigrisea]
MADANAMCTHTFTPVDNGKVLEDKRITYADVTLGEVDDLGATNPTEAITHTVNNGKHEVKIQQPDGFHTYTEK